MPHIRWPLISTPLVSLGILCCANTARAQDETLFHGGVSSIGFYAAPVVKLTEFAGRGEVLAGARVGLLFGRRFAVGVAGFHGGGGDGRDRVARPLRVDDDVRSFGRGDGLSYGGIELEYVILPAKLVHASIATLIGAGTNGGYNDRYGVPGVETGERRFHDGRHNAFFVAEPAANAEVNLAKYVRLALGVGYRFSAGRDQGIGRGNSGGATGTLGLKFGKL